jgi:phosphoglycerate dehydrogenase-like enzyme
MGRTLHGKILGIYGVGRIGSIVAEIAKGFGMQIVFFDKFVESLEGTKKVNSLSELVGQIDFLSIHVPLTDETRYSINSEVLNSAKQGMVLINTSRGDVVDSNALVAALDSGKLSGAGVDVWDSG